ncbi:hypothetical protein sscle_12g088360 [Sclerotinia sclerotiorum 1980 UF-70]|uniref:Integrase catalytic domain-containing protein n=1 Tax=Sclerotinia sclerotiorum (strain ATCC 18683 / 1980 / Ss-1) TaxID=665079 RepID=A0A1D9QGJ2_SCLS1|nr:hypothetical protein sscle_12g088360 [Sclerotinia sclerotiorum 1980 UF-70]
MIDIINTQFSLIQTQFGSKIRFIRFDDETTLGGDFKRITDKYGIIVERTPPNTPAQNGTAENAGKMLMVRARALLLLANLPQNLWPEAIKTAGYLENRTPKRALQWKTLFESATGNKPSLAHLYPYGCLAYVLNKQIPRRAKIATLSPEALTKQSTRDVPIPSLPESELSSSPSSSLSQRDIITTTSSYNTAPLAEQIHADIDVSYIIQGSRRSQRKEHHTTAFSSLPQLSSYFAVFAIGRSKLRTPRLHQNDLPPPPRFYHELVQHPYAREFRKACEDEINALKERKTFKYIDISTRGQKPLPLLWVFTYKFDQDGYLIKFKARICARGDLQSTEEETYAATLTSQIFRAMMAIAAAFDLEIR